MWDACPMAAGTLSVDVINGGVPRAKPDSKQTREISTFLA